MLKRLWRSLKFSLTDNSVGWLVLSVPIPCFALWIGFGGIFRQMITVKGAEVTGISAILYGCAFVSLGLGTLLMPRPRACGFHLFRTLLFLVIAAAFLMAGAISML
ncbi:hypothetical protein [Luteolibacter sp. AS25]|uniref:hypothetical protein n=1 Tax=Luteolibacter sp. AS25 TaxID=3135776 RepID=UPI00398B25B0